MSKLFATDPWGSDARMVPSAAYPPPSVQPARGGAASAFKWGAIFGVVAGVVSLIQVVLGVLSVNANLDGINQFESSAEFSNYVQCNSSGNSSNCAPLSGTIPGADSITAAAAAFYGTCLLFFAVTLVLYLIAARAASRASGRRGIGVLAAVIAAAVGSIIYLVGGIVALSASGRTGLFAGLGPFGGISADAWAGALLRATVFADVIGLFVALGLGALMGLWGAALGVRGALPPGYPPAVMYAPPGYMPFPAPTPAPPYQPPPAAAPFGYSMPAQYPPLPSHYAPQPPAPSPTPSPASGLDAVPETPTLPADPSAGGSA